MTGTLQNFSRKYKYPIDQLNFKFNVLDIYDPEKLEGPPKDGVYVYGLYMDAARWDVETRSVVEPRTAELYSVTIKKFGVSSCQFLYERRNSKGRSGYTF